MANRYQILLGKSGPPKEEKRKKVPIVEPLSKLVVTKRCPKGGDHDWGTDGQHSNEFCKKCFIDKYVFRDRFVTEDNKVINLFKAVDEL